MCLISSSLWQIAFTSACTHTHTDTHSQQYRFLTHLICLAESRAKVLSLKWITMRHSSARLWRRQSVGSACHLGRRSRCWWTDRRCCAPCTIQALDPASSTSAHTLLPMRFGNISLYSTWQHNVSELASESFSYSLVPIQNFTVQSRA